MTPNLGQNAYAKLVWSWDRTYWHNVKH
jgi:hypothetical protein